LREPCGTGNYNQPFSKLIPKYLLDREDKWRTYYPLKETPDLFLKFARLYRGTGAHHIDSVFVDSVLDWVHKYGLLGHIEIAGYAGSEETIGLYAESARWAAGILAMYEAALNGDEEAAKAAVLEEFLTVDPLASELRTLGERDAAAYKTESIEKHWNSNYLEYVLAAAMYLVTFNLREECLPTFFPLEGVSDPSKVVANWSFRSLYGAMYLQMYWLMGAGGDVTRCEYCGRIISLARPHPEGRKRRRDKRFCDDACRQAHHRSKKRA
jgi:hypothetical protein